MVTKVQKYWLENNIIDINKNLKEMFDVNSIDQLTEFQADMLIMELKAKALVAEIRENGVEYIAGNCVDVDTLQKALAKLGYTKGNLGSDEDIWYKNIIDNYGYIAHLEAISPDKQSILTAIVVCFDEPYIIGIQKRSKKFKEII